MPELSSLITHFNYLPLTTNVTSPQDCSKAPLRL